MGVWAGMVFGYGSAMRWILRRLAVNYLWRVEVSLAELGRCPHGCDDVDAVALP